MPHVSYLVCDSCGKKVDPAQPHVRAIVSRGGVPEPRTEEFVYHLEDAPPALAALVPAAPR